MSNCRFTDFIHSETKTSYKSIKTNAWATTSYIILVIALLMRNEKENLKISVEA